MNTNIRVRDWWILTSGSMNAKIRVRDGLHLKLSLANLALPLQRGIWQSQSGRFRQPRGGMYTHPTCCTKESRSRSRSLSRSWSRSWSRSRWRDIYFSNKSEISILILHVAQESHGHGIVSRSRSRSRSWSWKQTHGSFGIILGILSRSQSRSRSR
jgi:hypothetical protein